MRSLLALACLAVCATLLIGGIVWASDETSSAPVPLGSPPARYEWPERIHCPKQPRPICTEEPPSTIPSSIARRKIVPCV